MDAKQHRGLQSISHWLFADFLPLFLNRAVSNPFALIHLFENIGK